MQNTDNYHVIDGIKIPKKLTLMSTEISIVFDEDYLSDQEAWGCTAYCAESIKLTTKHGGRKIKGQTILDTLFHELTHWMLHKMGEDELNGNERFVNIFSGLLSQAFKTGWAETFNPKHNEAL